MNEALDEDDLNELSREMYAHFGLSYYMSEVVHRGLCNFMAMVSFEKPSDVTSPRIEEVLSHAYSLTLGQIKHELKEHLTSELIDMFDECLEKRNF